VKEMNMEARDEELEKAINEAIAKGPIPHEIHWSRMSTYFLQHVVDYFEGAGKSELQHGESREAYANAKSALQERQQDTP
jgi:hypothetical protein